MPPIDRDIDFLSDYSELHLGTNLANNDTDSDGMPDLWEIEYGLNPADPSDASLDCDSDGLSDLAELNMGTDPTNPDSDGDLFGDGVEVSIRSDPTDPMTPWLFIVSYIITGIIIIVLIFRMEVIYKKARDRTPNFA